MPAHKDITPREDLKGWQVGPRNKVLLPASSDLYQADLELAGMEALADGVKFRFDSQLLGLYRCQAFRAVKSILSRGHESDDNTGYRPTYRKRSRK